MNSRNWRRPLIVFLSTLVLVFVTTAVMAADSSPPADGNIPRDGPVMTEWIDPFGRQPMTFAELELRERDADPTQFELKFSSIELREALGLEEEAVDRPFVLALVNSNIYSGISAELDQWRSDVMAEGWDVELESATFSKKRELRAHLASKPGLDSVMLVGSFPVAMFEISGGDVFPIDLYYMDLDGTWSNSQNIAPWTNALDTHLGDTAPEIGLGRLTAGPLTYGPDEVTLLKDYLADNHAYRTGALTRPQSALNVVDNDWALWTGTADALELLYPGNVERIANPWETSGQTYKAVLDEPNQWLIVEAHASSFAQSLYPQGRFNFQPANAYWPDKPTHPLPWIEDGRPFGSAYSSRYGWNMDLTGRTYRRYVPGVPDYRYDTLVEMQLGQELDAVWEAEAPNGTYCVEEMIAGDPILDNANYMINLEGTTVLSGRPTAEQPFVTNSSGSCVEVNDGRVTISSAAGARKNRLAYLDLILDRTAGYVTNRDIYNIGPEALFYNLFSCSAGRYIEDNYIGGYYIFNDGPGLAAVASTKTGSMLDFDKFYGPLADGASLGDAFREWFAIKGINDRNWHYGMTLLGDPTLTMDPGQPAEESSINICMVSENASYESIDFSGDLGHFSLMNPQNNCRSFTPLSSGTYTVQQDLTGDWYATGDAYCEETHGEGASQWQTSPESATIHLAAGAEVECTFYNNYNPHEPNDSMASATAFAIERVIRAAIGSHNDVEWYDDVDFYRFSAQAGDIIGVYIEAFNGLIPYVKLRDDAGNVIVSKYDDGRFEQELLAAGDYFLEVGPQLFEGAENGTYIMALTLVDRFEPNDSLATATPITYGDTVRAVIEGHGSVEWYEDVDLFRFSGEAGDRIAADVVSFANLDPLLRLRDASGAPIDASVTGTYFEAHLTHVLQQTGDYFLEVRPDLYEGASGGAYELALNKGAGSAAFFVSANREHEVNNMSYARGDILGLSGDTWSMVFDASEHAIPVTKDLHAFTIRDNGSILMAFSAGLNLPGIGQKVTPWDIVLYTPDGSGGGSFSLFFDGSDVQLSTTGEKIDALDEEGGKLYISVVGRLSVLQNGRRIVADDEDVVEFTLITAGPNTTGVWERVFLDGSGVPGMAAEDTCALSIESTNPLSVYVSFCGTALIDGNNVGKKDIVHLSGCGDALCFGGIFWRGPDNDFLSAVDGLHISSANH